MLVVHVDRCEEMTLARQVFRLRRRITLLLYNTSRPNRRITCSIHILLAICYSGIHGIYIPCSRTDLGHHLSSRNFPVSHYAPFTSSRCHFLLLKCTSSVHWFGLSHHWGPCRGKADRKDGNHQWNQYLHFTSSIRPLQSQRSHLDVDGCLWFAVDQ